MANNVEILLGFKIFEVRVSENFSPGADKTCRKTARTTMPLTNCSIL